MTFRIIVAMFSVFFGVSIMYIINDFEKGNNEDFQTLNDLNPVGVFIGEILSVVLAIGVPIWAILGIIRH